MSAGAPETDGQAYDHHADTIAMVEEIGMAVATGVVPFVAQAINVYDTVQSLLTLHHSKSALDRAEAKFDLVLALVGWIPGAGSGVKKSIRIVNKHPERYAPILFDVLRLVCMKLGIQTSPEALLDKLFDAAGLKAQLATVQSVIEGSWLYKEMPSEGQMVVSSSMTMVQAELAAMVLLVTTKLLHWKKLQRNTAAASISGARKTPKDVKPAKHDPKVAVAGHDAPAQGSSNGTVNAQVGTAAVENVSKTVTGIVGEHITDYFLYEEYGWGKGWSKHDQGSDGKWDVTPGREYPGKLNEGTKLNRLFAVKAHGTGIDSVWKVQLGDPHNDHKPYAIVESKASLATTAPRNPSQKSSIRRKLLDNAKRIKEAALPKTEDLLEPDLQNGAEGHSTGSGKPVPTKSFSRNQRKQKQSAPSQENAKAGAGHKENDREVPIVQMSQRWIELNIRRAVDDRSIEFEILNYGTSRYSRHLFYTPAYLPTVIEHLNALQDDGPGRHEVHASHGIPTTHRYGEAEVKAAVNQKLAKLGLRIE